MKETNECRIKCFQSNFVFTGAKSRIEITISITEGPHHGIHKVLKPTQGKLLPKVGRSTGKHFLNHGISLPEDGEVSTTHGKVRTKTPQ